MKTTTTSRCVIETLESRQLMTASGTGPTISPVDSRITPVVGTPELQFSNHPPQAARQSVG